MKWYVFAKEIYRFNTPSLARVWIVEDVLNDKIVAWAKGWIWAGLGLFPKAAGRGR